MNFRHVAAFVHAATFTPRGWRVRRERLRIAPGQCVECGDDAYILLAGSDELVCAHCFALRRSPAAQETAPTAAARPAPPTRRAPLRPPSQHPA